MTDRRILVVEDDRDIRETLVEILGEKGYDAHGAVHGRDALAKLRDGEPRPCLIFLDLMMPVMDGWTFREEQLRDPEVAAIPVILLSAHRDISKDAQDLQVAGYLAKPVNLARVLGLVEEHCGCPPS